MEDELLQDTDPPTLLLHALTSATTLILLLFDGGARRNPETGVSGFDFVRVQPQTNAAPIVWMASISLGTKMLQTIRPNITMSFVDYGRQKQRISTVSFHRGQCNNYGNESTTRVLLASPAAPRLTVPKSACTF